MRKLFSTQDLQQVHILKGFLEDHGIVCRVEGEPLVTLGGEVPLTEGFLELWIRDDDRFEEARALLAPHLEGPRKAAPPASHDEEEDKT